jgi:hypothetical protein
MKVVAVAALAALLQGCADMSIAQNFADVEVVNRATGEVMPLHRHNGRTYVAGTPGEKYAVRVANRSSGRTLNVVSVDGVNAVTGETAAPDQSGYVLAPGQRFEVNGWRKSMSEVAAFYFTRLPDSYAARTDRPENVGVIGVAVFRERRRPPEAQVLPKSTAPSSAPPARAANESSAADSAGAAGPGAEARRSEKIGTGHGEREASQVAYTNFRRASATPDETLAIYYDTRANLIAMGVIPRVPSTATPNPFPAGRFVPDPRG